MMLKWQVANVFSMCVIHFDLRTQILTFFTHSFCIVPWPKGDWGHGTFPLVVSSLLPLMTIYLFLFFETKKTNPLKRGRTITLVLNSQILKVMYIYLIEH